MAIVGAGASGIATAAYLKRLNVNAVLFNAEGKVGESWRCHYDRLRLHTLPQFSAMPGHPIPREIGPWIAAKDYAAYLQEVANRDSLQIFPNTVVYGLRKATDRWILSTTRGECSVKAVVIATGMNRSARLPAWPGRDLFAGPFLHSSEYRNAEPFKYARVLVVGVGNSGSEIASDLAEAGADVFLSVRTAPNIMPKTFGGVPVQLMGIVFGSFPAALMDRASKILQRIAHGDLSRWNMPSPSRGMFSHAKSHRVTPVIDSGLVALIKSGRIKVVPAVDSFAVDSVRLCDGRELEVDAVVAATGYRADLETLLASHVDLDSHGLPALSKSAELLQAPGIYLCGFVVSLSGILHEITAQAERISTSIYKSLKYHVIQRE